MLGEGGSLRIKPPHIFVGIDVHIICALSPFLNIITFYLIYLLSLYFIYSLSFLILSHYILFIYNHIILFIYDLCRYYHILSYLF